MIKKLAPCIRGYRLPTVLTPICMILEIAMETAITFFMAGLINNLAQEGNDTLTIVLNYAGILLSLCLVALITGAFGGVFASRASAGFASNLRQKLFYKIQGFSFSSLDKFENASLITRMTTDVTNVQQAFQMMIRITVRCPMMLIFSLIMSFQFSTTLALVFLAVIPILGGGLFLIVKKAFPLFTKAFKKYDTLNRVVEENLLGIRVVKSYVREEEEEKKFKGRSREIYEDLSGAEKLVALNNPLMNFCMYGSILLIAYLGANIIVGGNSTLDVGGLTSLITYAGMILMSLMMMCMIFVMLTMARASAERIVEVLSEESDLESPHVGVKKIESGSIAFENVSFSYAKRAEKPVLDSISLDIKSGEVIGVIGGTGSAKSSLVQLIPRLYDVSAGAIKVGGVDVREIDLFTLREAVAMVLQKNLLFSGTIRENLAWGNEKATDEQMQKACAVACADEFVQSFPDGYDHHVEQGGTNLSGGQRQRLCIARALLKSPKILIMDDSTSAVDMATDASIRGALKSEMADVTKIIIAQRIASVEHADKIIVLEDGKVNAFDTPENLLQTNAIYREVYHSQTNPQENEQENEQTSTQTNAQTSAIGDTQDDRLGKGGDMQ